MTPITASISRTTLLATISMFESQRAEIDSHIAECRKALLSTQAIAELPQVPVPPAGKRTMTAAGRKRLAEAQKARWAAHNAAKAGVPAPTAEAKPKRVVSAAAKKNMAAAQKKRFAAKAAAATA